ncbi:hypothetical protein PoB_001224500 [Plakobranchus ocellatus]|uniref:G-protein coupled receptors family 1 profile domain-containing protein n=1 Tax=Plakobranchus ocellatus TaxID=259542 RepID=A0AAV3YSH8_9GAST|nr:hypothetical protein PoB_001224500 [Plakobranchus ocellatus]
MDSCFTLGTLKVSAAHLVHTIANVATNFLAPAILLIFFNILIAKELKHVEEREKALKEKPRSTLIRHSTKTEMQPSRLIRSIISDTTTTHNWSQNAIDRECESSADESSHMWNFSQGKIALEKSQLPNRSTYGGRGNLDAGFSGMNVDGREGGMHLQKFDNTSAGNITENIEKSYRVKGTCFLGNDKQSVEGDFSDTYELTENVSQNANKDNGSGLARPAKVMIFAPRNCSSVSSTDVGNQTDRTSQNQLSIEPGPSRLTLAKETRTFSGISIRSTSLRPEGHKRSINATWEATLGRVSIALYQPVDLDSWPSSETRSDLDKEVVVEDEQEVKQTPRMTKMYASVSHKPDVKRDSRITSLTRLLMVASTVFVCLNMPFWIYQLMLKGLFVTPDCAHKFIDDSLLLLRLSNHCLNFFFYCFTGSRFRQEFISWYRAKKCW